MSHFLSVHIIKDLDPHYVQIINLLSKKYQCIDLGRIQRTVVGLRNTITKKMEGKALTALPFGVAIVSCILIV
jgi:hypothetical protein